MLNVRLAGDHLYGKKLFTWLSLFMSLLVSLCAVLDVLDKIRDLIGSVSESFPTYFYRLNYIKILVSISLVADQMVEPLQKQWAKVSVILLENSVLPPPPPTTDFPKRYFFCGSSPVVMSAYPFPRTILKLDWRLYILLPAMFRFI